MANNYEPDEARAWTDAELAQMEEELSLIYRNSRRELMEDWEKYMARIAVTLDVLWQNYQNAPDADSRAEALKAYQEAVQNKTLRDKWYRDMVRQTTQRLANVNQIAADYVNGKLPEIYKVNYDQVLQDLKNTDFGVPSMGVAWDIRNEEMMRDLANGDIVLPGGTPGAGTLSSIRRTVNQEKDMAWNARQINSSLLQGILQGESVKQMSKRLMPIVNNNENSAIRAARTMTTGAENQGRLDSYRDLEKEGVVMQKVWVATPDGRVRDWHLFMDGQRVDVDDPFVDGNGEKLMRPADTSCGASGRTIWNCRCTLRSEIMGFRRADGSVSWTKKQDHTSEFHQRQINQEKARRAQNGQ